MEDALVVRVVNRFGDGLDERCSALHRQRPIADEVGEILTLDVVHREVVVAFVFADFVDGHNVRMLQFGGGFGFGLETLDEFLAGVGTGQNHFQGDDAVEARLPRLIHDTHAAVGDFFEQLVVAEVANLGIDD